jgi:hypothetical protein
MYVLTVITWDNAALPTSRIIFTWQTPLLRCKCNIQNVDYHVSLHLHHLLRDFDFACPVHSLHDSMYVLTVITWDNAALPTSRITFPWQTPLLCCKCNIQNVDYHVSLHLHHLLRDFDFVCPVHSLHEPMYVLTVITWDNAALPTSRIIFIWQTPLLRCKCNIQNVDYHISLHLHYLLLDFDFVCLVHSLHHEWISVMCGVRSRCNGHAHRLRVLLMGHHHACTSSWRLPNVLIPNIDKLRR